MGIPTLVRLHLYIKTAHWFTHHCGFHTTAVADPAMLLVCFIVAATARQQPVERGTEATWLPTTPPSALYTRWVRGRPLLIEGPWLGTSYRLYWALVWGRSRPGFELLYHHSWDLPHTPFLSFSFVLPFINFIFVYAFCMQWYLKKINIIENRMWWLCLVLTLTTRFATDLGYRMATNLTGLYKKNTFYKQGHQIP